MSRNIQNFFKVIDKHYLSLWDARDLPKIEKWQEKIRNRSPEDEQIVKDFFTLLDRKWNDHKSLAIEPLELSKKDDVLTFKGLAKCCRMITRQDSAPWTNVAVGTGAPADTNPMPFDQVLVSESYTVTFFTNGFFDGTGTSIRYGGTFGSQVVTDNYNESLVRNTRNFNDTGMITLVISSFFDNPISHTQGNTGFTAAGSIEFIPIADISQ